MEAPKCQFCGKKEWRHVCDQTPVNPQKTVVIEQEKKETVKVSKPVFDRKKYQREYMRAWRKKK